MPTTDDILEQVTALRARITELRLAQNAMWSRPDYPTMDDDRNDDDARRLYTVIHDLERQIEALALQAPEPTPAWPGGWLIGTRTPTGTTWIGPRDLDYATRIPAWRTLADAQAALTAAAGNNPPPRPRRTPPPDRHASWYPPGPEHNRIYWVGATRGHTIPGPDHAPTACEIPLDLIGWASIHTP